MNRFEVEKALVVVLLSLVLRCDRKATTSGGEPAASASAAAVASAPPTPAAAPPVPPAEPETTAKDAGPDEWYACRKAEDCVVVPEGRCCTPCDPVAFRGYTSVHSKHKKDFIAHEGCAATTCPACPVPDLHTPRSDSNFFARCKEGRCVAVDLRYSPYSQCKTHQDCALRRGVGCCEGCGDKELVTFNPASSLLADVCPTKAKCPPPTATCLSNRSPLRSAECVAGYCQLSDN
jgi:hypothetical protein